MINFVAKIHRQIFVLMTLLGMSVFFTNTVSAQSLADTFSTNDAASTIRVDNQAWNEILSTYLSESPDGVNRFDYGNVSDADKEKLEGYINLLTSIDPLTLNANEQMAYWINLYNAVTVNVVLDAYPIDTIRKIDAPIFRTGPWKKERVTVNGIGLSLDNIEHDILRPVFKDSRVHYGVNCASIGCPNLQLKAFNGDALNDMLNQAGIDYVNSERGVKIENGKLIVSSIYDWFKEDFGSKDESIIAHLTEYAAPGLVSKLVTIKRIDDDEYDWSLNNQ